MERRIKGMKGETREEKAIGGDSWVRKEVAKKETETERDLEGQRETKGNFKKKIICKQHIELCDRENTAIRLKPCKQLNPPCL